MPDTAVPPDETHQAETRWPKYEAAELGLREYWYPVMHAKRLRRKKRITQTVLGDEIFFVYDQDRYFAIHDRCPHRQVPLSLGKTVFPGHITCRYHGWTFKYETGELTAALTDGPDSPILGKVCLRTYPIEERCGLIFVWMGEGEPVPVEDDIPEEFLTDDARVYTRISSTSGNWRYAVENGFDEAHAKMLHRDAMWVATRRLPGWSVTRIEPSDDGKWITRVQDAVHLSDDYPGHGRWPRFRFWQLKPRAKDGTKAFYQVSVRLPGTLRSIQPAGCGWDHYEWYVPIDREHYLYVQIGASWRRGLSAAIWWLRHWTYIYWIHHVWFNNQDKIMVAAMPPSHPERLFRPDVSITAWRRMVEDRTRPAPAE